MSSFKPLRRLTTPPKDAPPKPKGASNIYLENPETGEGFWVEHGITDEADGVTDADFKFAHD